MRIPHEVPKPPKSVGSAEFAIANFGSDRRLRIRIGLNFNLSERVMENFYSSLVAISTAWIPEEKESRFPLSFLSHRHGWARIAPSGMEKDGERLSLAKMRPGTRTRGLLSADRMRQSPQATKPPNPTHSIPPNDAILPRPILPRCHSHP